MSAFLHGFLVGLGFLLLLGPVFFYLLKNALEKGFWVGFFIALGIVLGDLLCIVICSFGAVPFFNNPDNQFWIGMIGSLILLGLGIKYLVKPESKTKSAESPIPKKYSKTNYLTYLLQGFLINFVNPFVFIVWIGVIGYAETEYGYNKNMLIFLIAVLLGIFLTDLLKSYFAHKIKKFLTKKFMINLSRVFGVILIVFGVRVILYMFR